MQRDYTWTQQQDGLLMKGPITHDVHVRVDVDRARISILDDLTDANGRTDRQFDEYGASRFTPCHVVDAANWGVPIRGL